MMPGQPSPIVHIVDDDDDFRTALARLLVAEGYEVRTYATAGNFLLTPEDEQPGCMLLDLRMPGPSGLELQAALAERTASMPVIFMSAYGDVPSTVRAMKGGAVDFLTKPVRKAELLAAIQAALANDRKQRGEHERNCLLQRRYDSLTPREREVFAGVVAGRLNKQIGDDIGAAERTVKVHRAQVMAKMQASSIAELVHFADELHAAGLLEISRPEAAQVSVSRVATLRTSSQ
jgi:FixJ family two-component response regulator